MASHERFTTSAWVPPWVRHQHLARYKWAESFVAGNKVVDAACGVGYGSIMLALAGAESVRGFDIASEAIDSANKSEKPGNVEFALGDVTRLPLPDASIDVFVCFETIEHVPDDTAVIAEAARVIRPGGFFFCSSPNRVLTNPGKSIEDKPFNEHHVREYSREELDRLLLRGFSRVEWHGQTVYSHRYARRLNSMASVARSIAARFHQLRKLTYAPFDRFENHAVIASPWTGEPEFLLAACTR
jgi:ubiquinone/menaquinone biosynthesis C-methylase UbiE